jgi:hypothetical protein
LGGISGEVDIERQAYIYAKSLSDPFNTSIEALTKEAETLIKVPADYFKIVNAAVLIKKSQADLENMQDALRVSEKEQSKKFKWLIWLGVANIALALIKLI